MSGCVSTLVNSARGCLRENSGVKIVIVNRLHRTKNRKKATTAEYTRRIKIVDDHCKELARFRSSTARDKKTIKF